MSFPTDEFFDRTFRSCRIQKPAPVFETARMYTGPFPNLPLAGIYGVTSYNVRRQRRNRGIAAHRPEGHRAVHRGQHSDAAEDAAELVVDVAREPDVPLDGLAIDHEREPLLEAKRGNVGRA